MNIGVPSAPPRVRVGGRVRAQVRERLEKYVEKRGDEFCVISHQTGKNFGCYPTKAEADARLAQIHRFAKHGDHDQSTHGNWAHGGASSEPAPSGPTAEDRTPDMTTPAWSSVKAEIAAQGMGNCYQAAATLLIEAEQLGLQNPTLVQAMVKGQGPLAGKAFGHAWIEADGQVISWPNPTTGEMMTQTMRVAYDFSSGKTTTMPAEVYRALGGVEGIGQWHEYSKEEAFVQFLKTEVYGPWEDDIVQIRDLTEEESLWLD